MTRKEILINTASLAQMSMWNLMHDDKLTTEKVLRQQGYFKHVFNLLEGTLNRCPNLRTMDEDVAKAIVGFESSCFKLFEAVKKDKVDNPESESASNNFYGMLNWMETGAVATDTFAPYFMAY